MPSVRCGLELPSCAVSELGYAELRHNGVLRTLGASLVLWSTYIPLTQEYAASVTWLAERG